MSPAPAKAERAQRETLEPAPSRPLTPQPATTAQPPTELAALQAGAGNAALAAAATSGSLAPSSGLLPLQSAFGNGAAARAAGVGEVGAEKPERRIAESSVAYPPIVTPAGRLRPAAIPAQPTIEGKGIRPAALGVIAPEVTAPVTSGIPVPATKIAPPEVTPPVKTASAGTFEGMAAPTSAAVEPPPSISAAETEAFRTVQERTERAALSKEPEFAQSVEITPIEREPSPVAKVEPAAAAPATPLPTETPIQPSEGREVIGAADGLPALNAIQLSESAVMVAEAAPIIEEKRIEGLAGDRMAAGEAVGGAEKEGAAAAGPAAEKLDEEAALEASSESAVLGSVAGKLEVRGKESARADMTQSVTELTTASADFASLAATRVDFAPSAAETDQDPETVNRAREKRAVTEALATDFLTRNAGQLGAITSLGLLIPARIQTATETAKVAIDTAGEQQRTAVVAHIGTLRTQANNAAANVKRQIIAQHKAAEPAIQRATATAHKRVEDAQKKATDALAKHERDQIRRINTLYPNGDRDFRAAGVKVGNEAMARGQERSKTYLKDRNGESSILDGPLHDNRLEASADAAIKVAEAYKAELVKIANEQANKAQAGKAKDLAAVGEATGKSRATLQAQMKAALDGLKKSEQQALSTADKTKASLLSAVNANLATTLASLAAQEAAALGQLSQFADQKKQAVDRDAEQSITSLVGGVRQAGVALKEPLNAFVASAQTTTAPDETVFVPLLAEAQAQMDVQGAYILDNLEQGALKAEQGTTASGAQGAESLASLGQQFMDEASAQAASFTTGMTNAARAASSIFAKLQQGHTSQSGTIAATLTKGFEEVTKGIESLFNTIETNLEKGFKDGAGELEKGLREQGLKDLDKSITENAKKAADQVKPRWKKVLKVLLVIAVIVVVVLVAGPAVIGAVGAFAGALGASAGAATVIGTIAGGAIVGAAAGATIQMGNNIIDGQPLFKDVLKQAAIGAISGAIGGAGAAAAAKWVGGATIGQFIGRTAINFGAGVVGGAAGELAVGNPLTLEGVLIGAAIGLGVGAAAGGFGKLGQLGNLGKLGRVGAAIGKVATRVEGVQGKFKTAGEKFGAAAGGKVGVGLGIKPRVVVEPGVPTPTVAPKPPEVAPPTKPKAEVPEAPRRTTHENVSEVEDGIVAKRTTGEGGQVKVTKEGRVVRCASECAELRMKYADELKADPKLRKRLDDIEAIEDPKLKADKAVELEAELTQIKAKAAAEAEAKAKAEVPEVTPPTKPKVEAPEVAPPRAPIVEETPPAKAPVKAPAGTETVKVRPGRPTARPEAPRTWKGTLNEFGKRLRWPARSAKAPNVPGETELPVEQVNLDGVRAMGVDETWARQQAKVYRDIADSEIGARNPSARPRADWLERLADRLRYEPPGSGSGPKIPPQPAPPTTTPSAPPQTIPAKAELPRVAANQVGKPRARQVIQDVLKDIQTGRAAPRDTYKNRQGRLPTEAPSGGRTPEYIEYEVPTPGATGPGGVPSAGDRRIIYDKANKRYYYSGNFHAGGPGNLEGTAAKFVEITHIEDLARK